MADKTPGSAEPERSADELTVSEMAELESGTAGALSPLMARLDVVVTALICLGSALLAVIMPQLVESGGISIGRSFATMPPDLVPRLVFGALAAVAAVATVAAVSRLRHLTTESPGDEAVKFTRAAIVAAIVLFYALTVTWLGFILSTMIVAAMISYFLGLRNPLAYIPSVLIVPIVARFIFERLLLISLPRSRIEGVGQIEDQLMVFLVNTFLQ